jgi:hypothetical protein
MALPRILKGGALHTTVNTPFKAREHLSLRVASSRVGWVANSAKDLPDSAMYSFFYEKMSLGCEILLFSAKTVLLRLIASSQDG